MNSENRFNPISGFDYRLLDDPEFGEDSVREEIIVPIVRGLGYTANGLGKIVRSRKLLHPFVSIGSQQKKINIVPDYLFEIDNKPVWILEAKSPDQNIINSIHVEQAYSYAMHHEVKAKYFALCNGREFVLFHVSEVKPVIHFPMIAVPSYWDQLKYTLSPENIIKHDHRKLLKDFGLHIKRLGFSESSKLIFLRVPIAHIAKFNDDHYTFSNNISFDDYSYCASYDFSREVFEQLKGKIPDKAIHILENGKKDKTTEVRFADMLYYVDIECHIGNKLEENEQELFLPLRIDKIL